MPIRTVRLLGTIPSLRILHADFPGAAFATRFVAGIGGGAVTSFTAFLAVTLL